MNYCKLELGVTLLYIGAAATLRQIYKFFEISCDGIISMGLFGSICLF